MNKNGATCEEKQEGKAGEEGNDKIDEDAFVGRARKTQDNPSRGNNVPPA